MHSHLEKNYGMNGNCDKTVRLRSMGDRKPRGIYTYFLWIAKVCVCVCVFGFGDADNDARSLVINWCNLSCYTHSSRAGCGAGIILGLGWLGPHIYDTAMFMFIWMCVWVWENACSFCNNGVVRQSHSNTPDIGDNSFNNVFVCSLGDSRINGLMINYSYSLLMLGFCRKGYQVYI